MAKTPRARISSADEEINKELYNDDGTDVKRDNNNLSKNLDRIKGVRTGNTENNETLNILTKAINDSYRSKTGSISATSKVKEDDKADVLEKLSGIFQGETVTGDTQRYARYSDYRIIDKYVAEVSEAVDVLRDSILSPDDTSKKSTLYTYEGEVPTDGHLESDFEDNMKILFEKYDMQRFISNKIRTTLVNGDGFTIVDSLASEFKRVLSEDIDHLGEWNDDGIQLTEDMLDNYEMEEYKKSIRKSFKSHLPAEELNEAVVSSKDYKDAESKYIAKTTKEVLDMVNKNVKFIKDPVKILTDRTRYASEEYDKIGEKTRKKLDINGVYLRDVNPEDIIKLEVDHICIGYVYINRINSTRGRGDLYGTNPSGSMLSALTSVTNPDAGNAASYQSTGQQVNPTGFDLDKSFTANGNTALEYETLIDMLIQGIGKKMDNKFIEKNEDVRNLLLALVKTDYIIDKQVEITFLEPEKVHHIKLNSTETYGTSVLESSLFYAKMYLAALITNMMVKISQGRDKRIFYVDVDMDADIEGNIQQLIRDVRSNELPADLFGSGKSVNTVMSAVGSLDNFYIPTINGK